MINKQTGDKREKHRNPAISPKPKVKSVKELYDWFSVRNPDFVIVAGEDYGDAVAFGALPRSVCENALTTVYPAWYKIEKTTIQSTPFSLID